MRFELRQHLRAPVAAVAEAFADAAFYGELAALPKLGEPVVLSREADGDRVRLRVRYRFTGDLSPAARAVLDPARLTWVEESDHDLARHQVVFRLLPDHYPDRLKASGTYGFVADAADPSTTVRTSTGDVKVRAPLVGGAVERAIISGLRDHLDDEVGLVERWIGRR